MITKDNFFSNSLIKSYINDLNEHLNKLPPDERRQHILEIESHLFSIAVDKEKEGISINQLPQEVLKEFSSPNILASEILSEYEEDIQREDNKKSLQLFSYSTSLSIGGFGAFAVPIAYNLINLSAMLPFFLALIIGNLMLVFGKLDWNSYLLKRFKKIIAFRNYILGIAFGAFAIQIIFSHKVNSFSVYYLIIYVICTFIYFEFLKYVYNKKNNEKPSQG